MYVMGYGSAARVNGVKTKIAATPPKGAAATHYDFSPVAPTVPRRCSPGKESNLASNATIASAAAGALGYEQHAGATEDHGPGAGLWDGAS